MKNRYIKMILLFTGILMFSGYSIFAGVLSVSQCYQEQTNWCWAGCSQAILKYNGRSVAQCNMANYAWSRSDCCYNGSSYSCNQPNNMYNSSGSLQDILRNWGVSSTGYAYGLSLSSVQYNIDNKDPFVIRWGWSSGGGHFIVGYGYSGSTIYIMDPWDGKYTGSYDWVYSGGNHSWTHTLRTY